MWCLIRTERVWTILVVALLAWVAAVGGCTSGGGGGGGDLDDDSAEPYEEVIRLSAPPVEGNSPTYVWRQTEGPEVALRNRTRSELTFMPPEVTEDTVLRFVVTVTVDGVPQDFEFEVIVPGRDGVDPASQRPPAADAGSRQSVQVGDTVILDASGSNDPDGDELSFTWRQTAPAGTGEPPRVDLQDPGTVRPSFRATEPGGFFFEVAVSDGHYTVTAMTQVEVSAGGEEGEGEEGGEGEGEGEGEDGGGGGSPAERLQPADFTYEGAFRLPEDFNWGALGLSFYPDGDAGAGSLLVTGFEVLYDPAHAGESCWNEAWDCYAFFGEVAVPEPAVESDWENLPEATLVTGLTSFDGGLASTVHREYVFVSGLEYVPQRGSQTSDKLYGSINLWYAEGAAGENTFPTVWLANLDGTGAQGMFHVGPEETPYHGRKMGSYLFSVPVWYADQYLGGRTLMTGRARGTPLESFDEYATEGGSQGPTLFAFHAFDSDSATGDLDALPMLYYRVAFPGCAGPNVGDPAACDYPDYTMCDDWTGGAFVDDGSRRAIMLLGYKGLGDNCYDEPPVECNDPCSQSHGYHCQPYERQVIFYDVHQLGRSALGQQDPWVVLPYTIWRPAEFYLSGSPCWNVGGMAFDGQSGRLFMVERGLGVSETNATVVHVWSL